MQLSSLIVVYLCFTFWAHSRGHSPTSSPTRTFLVDTFFLLLYFTYLFLLLMLPLSVINQVSLVCRIIILCEQVRADLNTGYHLWRSVNGVLIFPFLFKVRILMKSHAFVRSNCPRVLYHHHHPNHQHQHHHHQLNDHQDLNMATKSKVYLTYMFKEEKLDFVN